MDYMHQMERLVILQNMMGIVMLMIPFIDSWYHSMLIGHLQKVVFR